jgi:DNA-binding beta-propeller fold protein YncE
MTTVGTQVWVINRDNNTISLFNLDGTVAGTPLSGNGLNGPYRVTVAGTQVWVVNNDGNSVSQFHVDGTPVSGSPLSGNGLLEPLEILVVNRCTAI